MAEENRTLNLRAHHLLCIPRYYSGGYSKVFAKQHKKICMSIRANPGLKIKIVKKCDDLCGKCPSMKDNVCTMKNDSNKNILQRDSKVLKLLNLKENSVHIAKEIFNLSMNKIPSVKAVCVKCDPYYKSCTTINNGTGINNSFRQDLNK